MAGGCVVVDVNNLMEVLNASRNQLTSFNEVGVLTELKAIILNGNLH